MGGTRWHATANKERDFWYPAIVDLGTTSFHQNQNQNQNQNRRRNRVPRRRSRTPVKSPKSQNPAPPRVPKTCPFWVSRASRTTWNFPARRSTRPKVPTSRKARSP